MGESKRGAGQPPIIPSPEKMERLAKDYFKSNDKYTISGLCYELGFESRQSFYDYEKRPEYSYLIKRLRLKIESGYESKLIDKEYATAGAVFALKNMGWSDRQEIDHTTNGENVNASPTKIVFKNFKEKDSK